MTYDWTLACSACGNTATADGLPTVCGKCGQPWLVRYDRGMPDVKMRAEVRANVEREVKAKLRSRIRDQVMQALLDATPVEPPRSLVQLEVQNLRAGARQELAARGIQVPADAPMPDEVFEQQAQRRVSLGLVLGEVVRAHGLHAKPEQVRALVEEQAQSYERPAEVVKWFYAAPERLRDIETAVLEDNIVAWALGAAKVTDKRVDFDELMGKR